MFGDIRGFAITVTPDIKAGTRIIGRLYMTQELADRVIDHYERHARAWDADRRMAGWNDKPWHDRFVAALPSAANVLDLGCGSGSPVAQFMAERGLHLAGVDSSPTLIRCAANVSPIMNGWSGTCVRYSFLVNSMVCSRGIASFTSRPMINGGCSTCLPITQRNRPC